MAHIQYSHHPCKLMSALLCNFHSVIKNRQTTHMASYHIKQMFWNWPDFSIFQDSDPNDPTNSINTLKHSLYTLVCPTCVRLMNHHQNNLQWNILPCISPQCPCFTTQSCFVDPNVWLGLQLTQWHEVLWLNKSDVFLESDLCSHWKVTKCKLFIQTAFA